MLYIPTLIPILELPLSEVAGSVAKTVNNTFYMDTDYQNFIKLITTTFTGAIELKQSAIALVTSINLDAVKGVVTTSVVENHNSSADLATRFTWYTLAHSLLCAKTAVIIKPYVVKIISYKVIASKSTVIAYNFIAQPAIPYLGLIKLGYVLKNHAFLLVPLLLPISMLMPVFIDNLHNLLLSCLSSLPVFSGKLLKLLVRVHQYILYIKLEWDLKFIKQILYTHILSILLPFITFSERLTTIVINARSLIQRFIVELRRSLAEFHRLYDNNLGVAPLGIDDIVLPGLSASPLMFNFPRASWRDDYLNFTNILRNFNRAYQSINNYRYSISEILRWFRYLAAYYGGYLAYVLIPLVELHIVPLNNTASHIYNTMWNVAQASTPLLNNMSMSYSNIMSDSQFVQIHDIFVNQADYLAMIDSGALTLVDSFVLFAYLFGAGYSVF